MPLCKKCGHPHAWYQGLCRPCAIAAGMALVPTLAPEPEVGAVAEDKVRETKMEEAQSKPLKAPRRRTKR